MAYSDLGEYLFVSMDRNRLVGSIYYKNGRIRLVHSHGPTVELLDSNELVAYFVLPNDVNFSGSFFATNASMLSVYEQIYSNGGRLLTETCNDIKKEFKKVDPYGKGFIGINACNNNYYLYEVYCNRGFSGLRYSGDHPSRGFPCNCYIQDIDSDCYRDLYYYAIESKKYRNNVKMYNFLVFGCFYGWYRNYPPFNIHSPYENDICK